MAGGGAGIEVEPQRAGLGWEVWVSGGWHPHHFSMPRPPDTAATAETAAAGGMHAQGEECGCAGASAGGGGGEDFTGPCLRAGGQARGLQPRAFIPSITAPSLQETVRQFRGAVGEQLGKMRVFLAALEGSLDREAERVRGEAGVALRRELGSLNSYLEQLRQMEKVLEEVADKPQTEFLMVSTG